MVDIISIYGRYIVELSNKGISRDDASLATVLDQETQPYNILGCMTDLNKRSLWLNGYALSVSSFLKTANFFHAKKDTDRLLMVALWSI